MNKDYVQNLRYKLQKRVRRLNSMNFQMFHVGLRQFWGFLQGHSMFQGIVEDLMHRSPAADADAAKIVTNKEALVGTTETEAAAIGYAVLQRCAANSDPMCEVELIQAYEPASSEYDDWLEVFRDHFLEPFYEYMDEQLDDQRAVLALLLRYKHKCEWFARKRLFELWEGDVQRGERNLARHLYEYLHDQGMEFHIEPRSASGEADLIAAQGSDDPLIADAKIFNPAKDKGRAYIARGFAQVYHYTMDYNEPFGYVVIYQTSEDDLRLTLSNKTLSTPFVVHNNKTIFLLTIDIYPHDKSASKRGVLEPVEITEDDLIRVATEEAGATTPSVRTQAPSPAAVTRLVAGEELRAGVME